MQTIATSTIPQEVPLSALVPSPSNPRQHFDEDKLNELAETIRKSGVYQAILARPKDNTLEIVFGERRYRASLIAGKETIPALIREMNDAEVLEAQLVIIYSGQAISFCFCGVCTSWICPRRADLLVEEGIASCP